EQDAQGWVAAGGGVARRAGRVVERADVASALFLGRIHVAGRVAVISARSLIELLRVKAKWKQKGQKGQKKQKIHFCFFCPFFPFCFQCSLQKSPYLEI